MAGRLIALRLPPDLAVRQLREVWDAGDAVLPLPVDAADRFVHATLERLRPDEVIEAVSAEPDGRPLQRTPLPRPRGVPDGTALVVSTSGSTGEPKGVVLSHRALEASTSASVEQLGARRGDRFVLALPLHHVAGLQVLLRSWDCGSDARIVDDPGDPARLVPEPGPTGTGEHISLVPTQLRRLVDLIERGTLAADSLAAWRTILIGGAHLDPALDDRARALGARIVTSYGMTETCGGCVYDGRPLRDVEVALRDDGRIRLRGPVLFSGYLTGSEAATSSGLDGDGWFTTGDLGAFDGDRLQVLGRHDDIIVSGGENVPAHTVAATLQQHPRVAEAAVIGVPDDEWGQRVVAVVVPRDPDTPPTLTELRAHVAGELPSGYAPRQLVLTSALPRDGLGKPTASALRALADTAP